MNSAATSIAAGKKTGTTKNFFKTGGNTKTGGNGAEVTVRSSLLSRCTPGARNEEARNSFQTLYFPTTHRDHGRHSTPLMTLRLDTEAGKHRAFKGETKVDN